MVSEGRRTEAVPGPDETATDEAVARPSQLTPSTFFSRVIGSLASNLENVCGYEDAAAFVTMVGSSMGEELSEAYAGSIADAPALAEGLAAALVDLKARIGGGFRVESIESGRIVFVNSVCPFAQQVKGRPSLCMMTTNVFGRIAADSSGYARVEIEEAIALGHSRCRVVVDLDPDRAGDGYRFWS
ncbi:transcriptional regulator [Pseudoroseicyclus sp. CLL3-39]|uniref:Transcriptional regulator n=2 Tax=Pseudoroseicyclus tamaricis TaxID=2705421 RepID=A0A6B2JNQ0_9RHOB|nr:transcriptional regulator [Pseudoroseicyclus tamaricis]